MANTLVEFMNVVKEHFEPQVPNIDKIVRIVCGDTYNGLTGKVVRYEEQKFKYFPNETEAQKLFRQLVGREGYVVAVELDTKEVIYVSAESTTVIN